jgi:DNA primase
MQSHLPAISPEIDSVEAHALFAPFLDDLRAQLLVAQAVRPRVKFKKSGRQWRAFRPLTRKGPAFFVNDQKSMWFHFSAGKSGTFSIFRC